MNQLGLYRDIPEPCRAAASLTLPSWVFTYGRTSSAYGSRIFGASLHVAHRRRCTGVFFSRSRHADGLSRRLLLPTVRRRFFFFLVNESPLSGSAPRGLPVAVASRRGLRLLWLRAIRFSLVLVQRPLTNFTHQKILPLSLKGAA